ncbi:MAG: A24 family peptidase [Pseudomonadota bacterium]
MPTHIAADGYVLGIVALVGLLVGSFLNVVIGRLPTMKEREWLGDCAAFVRELAGRTPSRDELGENRARLLSSGLPAEEEEAAQPRFDLVMPHSCCPHCGHRIRAYENIPVLSYLALRGRCSSCRERISVRYPVVEIMTAVMSVTVVWQLGVGVAGLAAVGFTWALLAASWIDADTQYLPDDITLPLLWAGLLLNLYETFVPLEDAVLGATAGYLSLWLVYWGFKLLTGKEGMGYGDFKLLAALGAWMGPYSLIVIILLSSVVGAIAGIAMIVFKGRERGAAIPFGPYLAAAGWLALIWGDDLSNLYLRTTGIGPPY